MSCCDVRGWGVARESDKVNQRTDVQESARKRERESMRVKKRERESATEKKREREREYALSNDASICIHILIHICMNR